MRKKKKILHNIPLLLMLSHRNSAFYFHFQIFLKSDYSNIICTPSLANFKFETDVHMDLKTAYLAVKFFFSFSLHNYECAIFFEELLMKKMHVGDHYSVRSSQFRQCKSLISMKY